MCDRPESERPTPRRRLRRAVLYGSLLVFLGLLALYAALPYIGSRPALHRWIEAQLLAATEIDIRFADLRLGYDLSVEVNGLTVAAAGDDPFLTVERAAVRPRTGGRGAGPPAAITLTSPHLHPSRLPASGAAADGAIIVPSGSRLAAMLRGQRVAVVDGFVHLGANPEEVLGPWTLEVDALGLADGLRIAGTTGLDGTGNEAAWSAELGPNLSESRANIRAVAAIDGLLRAYAQIELPDWLRPVTASLALDLSGTDTGQVALVLVAEMQAPLLEKPLPVRASGTIDLTDRTLKARLEASEIDVHSEDFLRAASGVAVVADVSTERTAGGSFRFDVAAQVSSGELLWDRFYVDLGQHPLDVRGQVDPSAGSIRLNRMQLAAGGVGTIRGNGTYRLGDRRLRGKVDFDIPGLSALFRLAVREPLAESHPLIAAIDVAGRAIGSLEQSFSASGARRIHGRVEVARGRLTSAERRIELSGVDVRLPVDLQEGIVATRSASETGWLHVAAASWGDVAVERIALPLTVRTNRLGVESSVRVDLFGGHFDLHSLSAEASLGGDPRAQLSFALHDLDLASLTSAVGLPRVAGKVFGSIPNLTWEGQEIRSEGEIRADLFGGYLRLRPIAVDALFSRVPALHLDADFDDLSLAQMTRTFAVGQITGIVGGAVENLTIVAGQPASFTAWVATKPRSRVAQRISVRAIRQISILGGAGGDPLTQGVLSLFDEYRYAKMGFRCRLENDRFHLGGVERIDGKEYLVVGARLPPRVSVISHTRVVAFSELLRRLARVAAVEDDT